MHHHPIAHILVSLLILSIAACQSDNMKRYEVRKADRPVQLSGMGTDQIWESAVALSDFTFPWRSETAPATTFRALWDDTHFYFLYRALDPEIISKQEGLGERDVVDSDRVEIFFKADDRMDPYHALEMDALGRVLDTKGIYYRNVDYDWNWPDGHLQLKASTDADGYWVEGSISLESLRQLGLYQDDHLLKAGLFRGDYRRVDKNETEVRWISWVMPDSEKPDFHIPSSFGELLLVE